MKKSAAIRNNQHQKSGISEEENISIESSMKNISVMAS